MLQCHSKKSCSCIKSEHVDQIEAIDRLQLSSLLRRSAKQAYSNVQGDPKSVYYRHTRFYFRYNFGECTPILAVFV